MDYQITCVCGQRFLVPEDKIRGPVTCPACRQKLSPVVETSPPANAAMRLPAATGGEEAGAAAEASPPAAASGATAGSGESVMAEAEPTKRCPYCGEVILAIARKCKHCGEFLDRAPPPAMGADMSAAATPSALAGAATPGVGAAPGGGGGTDVPPEFSLTVSQWDNFWKFLILLTVTAGIVAALLLVPMLKERYAGVAVPGVLVFAFFIAWYFYLSAKTTRYYIRPARIDVESGIISKDLNSLEMFRISDMELKQGMTERVLGIGTIKLATTDASSPELSLYQIPHVRTVYKYIQTQIPIAAKQRGAIYMEK